jgi:hypothetical protein
MSPLRALSLHEKILIHYTYLVQLCFHLFLFNVYTVFVFAYLELFAIDKHSNKETELNSIMGIITI